MPQKRKTATDSNPKTNGKPRSLPIAVKGITTGAQFANLMSALMSDLIEGNITPAIGNATCNAGGKLLKIVELQYKYGTQQPETNVRVLHLTELTDPPSRAITNGE